MKKIKKIKLQCATGGHSFGDVVEISKDGITNEVANGLVGEGLAVEVADEATVSTSKAEAGQIIADAKVEAEGIVSKAKEAIEVTIEEAGVKAGQIVADAVDEAKTQAEGVISDAETKAKQIKAEAKDKKKK